MKAALSPSKCTSAVPLRQKLSSSEPTPSGCGLLCVPPAMISVTVMRFSVSVPVLSEQMTFIAPIVSQAAIFLTRALCFDILIIFIASETATMVGSPSGTAATISTMLVMKASETVSSEAVPLAMKEAS